MIWERGYLQAYMISVCCPQQWPKQIINMVLVVTRTGLLCTQDRRQNLTHFVLTVEFICLPMG